MKGVGEETYSVLFESKICLLDKYTFLEIRIETAVKDFTPFFTPFFTESKLSNSIFFCFYGLVIAKGKKL